jgi:ribose 5-phosphate isomerase B
MPDPTLSRSSAKEQSVRIRWSNVYEEPNMRLVIGSDHAAYDLKEYLKNRLQDTDHEVEDLGTHDAQPADYPAIGYAVAAAVADGRADRGIALCGTGLGMSMVANKVPGVRAALAHDEYTARMSRAHNNANVLTMGGRVTAKELAWEILKVWLCTEFDGKRHQRRVDAIMALETKAARGHGGWGAEGEGRTITGEGKT